MSERIADKLSSQGVRVCVYMYKMLVEPKTVAGPGESIELNPKYHSGLNQHLLLGAVPRTDATMHRYSNSWSKRCVCS